MCRGIPSGRQRKRPTDRGEITPRRCEPKATSRAPESSEKERCGCSISSAGDDNDELPPGKNNQSTANACFHRCRVRAVGPRTRFTAESRQKTNAKADKDGLDRPLMNAGRVEESRGEVDLHRRVKLAPEAKGKAGNVRLKGDTERRGKIWPQRRKRQVRTSHEKRRSANVRSC